MVDLDSEPRRYLLIQVLAVALRYSTPDEKGIYFDRWTGRTCITFTEQCFEKK